MPGEYSAFFGNLPPTITESELAALASRYGSITSVRLPRDKSSGKVKPFGFIDLADEGSLQAVVANLNGTQVHGNVLRVDRAGSGGGGGGGGGGSSSSGNKRERDGSSKPSEPAQPSGLEVLANADPQVLGEQIDKLPLRQVWEILNQIKQLVDQDEEGTRQMLNANPALCEAMLKAQVRMGMITQEDIDAAKRDSAPPMAPPPMDPSQQPPPPMMEQQQYMEPPPPPPQQPQQQYVEGLPQQELPQPPPDQAPMIMQVLALTPEQVAALPPEQKQGVEMLRAQWAHLAQ